MVLGQAAWVVVALLVIVISAEVAVRVEDWLQYDVELDSPYRSEAELFTRDSLGIHGRPGAKFEKWTLNSLGLRGPDAAVNRGAGDRRVLVLGASETFGLYESPGHEYPRLLEMRLNSDFAVNGCGDAPSGRWEVLNAALPGMSLPTIIQDFRVRLRQLKPDVVVVYPTPVQYLDVKRPAAPTLIRGDKGSPPPSALRLRSANRFRSSFKAVLPEVVVDRLRRAMVWRDRGRLDAYSTFTDVPLERVAAFSDDLGSLIDDASAEGARVVVVAHVNAFPDGSRHDDLLARSWQRFYPLASPEVIIRFDSLARGVTREVAQGRNADYLNPTALFSERPRALLADASHFSDEGAQVLADTLAKHIGSWGCGMPPRG